MGPVSAFQAGIGLVAELKAAKAEQKITDASVRNGVETSTEPPLAQVKRLQIDEKAAYQVNEDSQYDENFGGATLPAYENDSSFPNQVDDDLPPPYPGIGLSEGEEVGFPLRPSKMPPARLSCPVIIPQRRPGTKIRGFVRAYAPILADYDIDQDAFLNFLKSFHKASQASPTLAVLTVGAGALGNVPEPGSMLVGMGLSLMGLTAMEYQGRHRANTYLDKANEEFFKPRGLYCLVMSFRPDDVPKGEVALEEVDTSKEALKWLNPPTSGLRAKTSRFRDSSGTTRGETSLPESAPLIYPDTGYAEIGEDEEDAKDTEDAKKGSYSKRRVMQNYFDKRAQAKYAYEHPDSALAVEKPPQFASKYGDPTHPTVTASTYDRISSAVGKDSLEEKQVRKREKAMEKRSSGGKVRRILQTSVLYLMIVNLPTEEQLETARKAAESHASRSSSESALSKQSS